MNLDDEEKHHFNKPHGARVYFHGQIEHDDYEKKKLAEFQEYLKTKIDNKYDQNYYNVHMLVLFLSCHHYKPEETYEAMKKHMEFRRKYVRDEKERLIITYENDAKVKKLIVNNG